MRGTDLHTPWGPFTLEDCECEKVASQTVKFQLGLHVSLSQLCRVKGPCGPFAPLIAIVNCNLADASR